MGRALVATAVGEDHLGVHVGPVVLVDYPIAVVVYVVFGVSVVGALDNPRMDAVVRVKAVLAAVVAVAVCVYTWIDGGIGVVAVAVADVVAISVSVDFLVGSDVAVIVLAVTDLKVAGEEVGVAVVAIVVAEYVAGIGSPITGAL